MSIPSASPRTITIAFVILLVACTSSGQASPSASEPAASEAAELTGTLAAIQERGELRVAGAVYPPFVIQNPDGSFEGVDIELAKLLAEQLGVELTMVPAGWDTIVVGLTEDHYELIPSLVITAERDEVIDFSDPYLQQTSVYVVRKDDPLQPTTVEDLNQPEVTIPVPTGTINETIVNEYTPNANIVSMPGRTDADVLQELLSGRANAILVDAPVTSSLIRGQYGDVLTFIPDEENGIAPTEVAYGVPQGDGAWREYVNAFIAEMESNGTVDRLLEEWLVPEHINPE